MLQNLHFPHKYKGFLYRASLTGLVLAANLLVFFNSALAFAPSDTPYLKQINAVAVAKPTSSLITIAVIDEGIDSSHPEFANVAVTGKNFVLNNNDLTPLGDHGTEVAGVITAVAEQAGYKKINLMSLIACRKNYGCDIEPIVKAIYYAVDNGAGVINLSLATSGYTSEFDSALRYARAKNVVVVAAAGNSAYGTNGKNLSATPVSPACNDNGQNLVLGVSSVDDSGNRPLWANYGGCVDVSAPGTNIYTSFSFTQTKSAMYGYEDGTSFSAPQVSVLAAIVKTLQPKLSASQVITAIKNGANSKGLINMQKTISLIQASKISTTMGFQMPKVKMQTAVKTKPVDMPPQPATHTALKLRGLS